MPHILVDLSLPGIRSLMAFRPETAQPMCDLAEALLRDTEGLSPVERELIGTYVSYLNDCFYCHHSHAAVAACYLDGNTAIPDAVRKDFSRADISDKLKALLQIAAKVQQGGKAVRPEDIENARRHEATDREIHDTVLIAAAFCMFNRYVDGLATVAPTDMSSYPVRAKQVAEQGYGSHIYSSRQPIATT
ncbi:MAG: peroxidase-related enzyme [Bacteroidota bacterium]|nr:peroxidase-related enzyme [Bacteroidota bacterium]MDP4216021.1 peroxidase-related enzyme [Bacteroidota bacterium]MDP4247425.1 peroxidase-related enzyme [Bacteroidota bacterium]MDP4254645.1 peroxidase-related enzyme [Bacteroidota bacterium]MDP4256918.1 peroxidase-related enzyme [Bacteroidota bacterium]